MRWCRLLRDHGVDVVVADDIAGVERAARPDTLIVMAQTFYLLDEDDCDGWPTFPVIGCWSNPWRGPGRAGPRDPAGRPDRFGGDRIVTCARPPRR